MSPTRWLQSSRRVTWLLLILQTNKEEKFRPRETIDYEQRADVSSSGCYQFRMFRMLRMFRIWSNPMNISLVAFVMSKHLPSQLWFEFIIINFNWQGILEDRPLLQWKRPRFGELSAKDPPRISTKQQQKNEPHSFECLLFEQYAAIYLPAEQINKESHSCSIDSAATLSIPLRCSASIRSYEQ